MTTERLRRASRANRSTFLDSLSPIPHAYHPALTYPQAAQTAPAPSSISLLFFSGTLEGVSRLRRGPRIRLLQQSLGLHDPGRSFVFAAETGDRPELTASGRHRDVE